MSCALDLSPVRLWVRLRIRLWVRMPRRPAAAPTGPWARAHRHKSTLYYKLKDCASIDRSNNARRHANRDLQLPVVTGPSVVAGRLAVARKADTRRRRRSRITSYVHHRRSRCSARGPTTAPFAPPSLRLRLRLECACARGPQAPPCEPQVAAIFAVHIPLIKSDSNVTR